ncbi:LuxR family transcriptional regulator [Pseudomonas fluorescens]|uniref:Transcriptional activator protein AnoR n=1 Tax=Pseudomonas fluorescens TaxID=294 RepID=A0A5E7ARJ9_PSEFL|nr:LuxR family transcriptional regulator [Pseudomonas fluorescens]VVN80640.1 Transcriptional activator protein AnoR [Pseudomonas fluorescens]
MDFWTEAQLKRLNQEHDLQTVFKIALNLTRDIGFEFCAFTMNAPGHHQQPQALRINNYSFAWNEKYELSNYVAIDPIVHHCNHSVIPIIWSDQVFANAPAYWEDMQKHGMHHGISQSVHDPRGVCSMLSLSRSRESIGGRELYEKAAHIIWLCHALHTAVVEQLLRDPAFRPSNRLSTREIEVLKWSAEGKTASDIATILNLSERTVNFHVSTAIKKMGVNNKIAAVVHAVMEGLLDPSLTTDTASRRRVLQTEKTCK